MCPEQAKWKSTRLFAVISSGVIFMIFACGSESLYSQTSAFNEIWTKKVSRKISGSELRESLERIAELQEFGFFLDRRVNPNRILEFEANNQTTRDMLAQLADSLELGFYEMGPIAYIGPREGAKKLAALRLIQRDRIVKYPQNVIAAFAKPIGLKTEKLDTPREILEKVAERMNVQITNPESIPHDLWPSIHLPPVPAADLLTLLLIGFDAAYTISPDGTRITIVSVPLNADELIQKSGVANAESIPGGSDRNKNAGKKNSAAAKETTKETAKSSPLSKRLFTITIKDQSADVLLRTFADRLGLTLEIDKESLQNAGISLDSRVSFDLKEATAQELFQAVLRPIGCRFTLSGKKLTVSAK